MMMAEESLVTPLEAQNVDLQYKDVLDLLKKSLKNTPLGSGEFHTAYVLGQDRFDNSYFSDYVVRFRLGTDGNDFSKGRKKLLKSQTSLIPPETIFTHEHIAQELLKLEPKYIVGNIVRRHTGLSIEASIKRDINAAFEKTDSEEIRGVKTAKAASKKIEKLLTHQGGKPLEEIIKSAAFLGWCGAQKVDAHVGNIIRSSDGTLRIADVHNFFPINDWNTQERAKKAREATESTCDFLRDDFSILIQPTLPATQQYAASYDTLKTRLEAINDDLLADIDTYVAQLKNGTPPKDHIFDWQERLNKKPAFAKVENVEAVKLTDPPHKLLEALRQVEAHIGESPVRG